MESRHVDIDGLRVRWEEEGEGRPVVLVHGIPTSPRLWRRVVPSLRGARAMAWELVGYGASIPEGRDRDIGVARQAEYLTAWMRTVGLDRAILVGHDLGGGVAQIVAARHPENVAGLVLVHCIAYDNWPVAPVRALRRAGPLVERLPPGLFERLYHWLLARGHDDRRRAEESFREHWPYYASAGPAALVRQTRDLDTRDTLDVAHRIPDLRLPARVVWGAADPLLRIGYGYRLAHELRAPMDRIDGARHFVPEDHPERVAAAVNAVIEEVAAAERAA